MKKTNKRPDGTEEVLEGDPEELRKYEDLQKGQPTEAQINESPKKPGILHGAEVDGVPLTENEKEWVRTLRKLSEQEDRTGVLPDIKPWEPYRTGPIWVVSCSMCGRVGCQGGCWLKFEPHPWYRITCSSDTTPKVSLLLQEDGSSRFSHSLADVLMGRATVEVKTNGN